MWSTRFWRPKTGATCSANKNAGTIFISLLMTPTELSAALRKASLFAFFKSSTLLWFGALPFLFVLPDRRGPDQVKVLLQTPTISPHCLVSKRLGVISQLAQSCASAQEGGWMGGSVSVLEPRQCASTILSMVHQNFDGGRRNSSFVCCRVGRIALCKWSVIWISCPTFP